MHLCECDLKKITHTQTVFVTITTNPKIKDNVITLAKERIITVIMYVCVYVCGGCMSYLLNRENMIANTNASKVAI
jgi:predicted DNA binding protein